jgi:hypothetical protein
MCGIPIREGIATARDAVSTSGGSVWGVIKALMYAVDRVPVRLTGDMVGKWGGFPICACFHAEQRIDAPSGWGRGHGGLNGHT